MVLGEKHMKWRKWITWVLMAVCVAALLGYRYLDRVGTDNEGPEIKFDEEPLRLSVTDDEDIFLSGVSAWDQRDGDVTASLVVESVRFGSDDVLNISYAAFDSSGNVSKVFRQAEFTDYESPRFSLEAPLMFTENASFDLLGVVSVTDVLDGDLSHNVKATSLDESSIATVGTHDIQLRVTNSLGDTAALILPVEVSPVGTYHGKVTLSDYLVYIEAGSSFDARRYALEYTLNGEAYDLTDDREERVTLTVTGEVDTSVAGVYVVTYKVECNEYTGCSRLIVVVEG